MQFKQISTVPMQGYVLVYCLNEEGNIYVLKASTMHPSWGSWEKVKTDNLKD